MQQVAIDGQPKSTFTQHPPDGSEAQRLLGGPMEVSYDFVDDD